MDSNDIKTDRPRGPGGFWKSRSGLVLCIALAGGALVLGYLYRDRLFGDSAALLLLLLVCVGMHLFMHRGHGGGSGGHS